MDTTETHHEPFRCSKNFPHPDGDRATELLLISSFVGEDWIAKPRCAAHPAADDIRMLARIDPILRCIVVPLDDEPGENDE